MLFSRFAPTPPTRVLAFDRHTPVLAQSETRAPRDMADVETTKPTTARIYEGIPLAGRAAPAP